jgi:pimeloyl-ACP methyl ester carboxylesterase
MRIFGLVLLILLTSMGSVTQADVTGFSKYYVDAAGTEFKVFAYHPPACAETDILVVLHGLNRKAERLRDKAVDIANKNCLTVFAPLFDKMRFPNWRYHRAGVYRSGKLQPKEHWTGPIFQALLDKLRELSGMHTNRLYLFGHSAGAQFLSRISAYSPPTSVDSIVIANPSVHVLPVLDATAPEGFAGLFSEFESRRKLRAYLALPISIYLGKLDTGDKYLVKSKEAMRLGETRLERGRFIFRLGEQVAKENGWTFNWNLVEVSDVGHSSGGMLAAPELRLALRFLDEIEDNAVMSEM